MQAASLQLSSFGGRGRRWQYLHTNAIPTKLLTKGVKLKFSFYIQLLLLKMTINEKPLLALLNAKAKNTLDDIFVTCYRFRYDGVPERKLNVWMTELEISSQELQQLILSVNALIRDCMFHQKMPAEILSADFHPQLAGLIGKIISKHFEEWRQSALNNSISPPKLIDFDWRVDTKMASDSLAKMSQSSLLLSLTVEETPTQKGVIPSQTVVNLELSKQELASLLDGFTKIRDQLGAINA